MPSPAYAETAAKPVPPKHGAANTFVVSVISQESVLDALATDWLSLVELVEFCRI